MGGRISCLAAFGGTPAFRSPLPVGQLNFIEWERFETAFRGIFSRRYYTNHGPLAQELESRLRGFFGVRHVVCVTNATVGLMIAAKALKLVGKVIVPAFTFAATVQSLTWAGLEPVFCDVDTETHLAGPEQIEPLLDDSIDAILGVHLWGNACDAQSLSDLAQSRDARLYFDAAHAFGCTRNRRPVGGFGDLEVFSFHATKVLNAAEGGCICTNDEHLAARLRNIRSSYGAGDPVRVSMTGNGRMSEAQAALALLSLEDYPHNRDANRQRFELYTRLLSALPGIRFVLPRPGEASNYQYVVAEIDQASFGLSRDALVRLLEAENVICRRYFTPGMHRCPPYMAKYPQYVSALPVTDRLCERLVQFPSGQPVSLGEIARVCELITMVHENAASICDWMGRRP